MANLVPFPLEQPGVAGLNKEGRNTILGPTWATKVDNLIIDDEGRLALRSGTKALASSTTLDSEVQVNWTFRTGAGGVQTYCATKNGTVYELFGGAWTSVDSGLPDGNVQFTNVNGIAYYVHSGAAKARRQATSGGAFAQIATSPTSPKACVGLYGRLWLMTDDEVYTHTTVLDPTSTYNIAASLGFAFGEGGDEGVALAEFNGTLVIFGKNNTVIYANPADPFASGTVQGAGDGVFSKLETLLGVGCLHRDSVQNVGKDILFLSNLGMRNLGRTIQEKSNPVTDSAPQVRDYILDNATAASDVRIKSAFISKLGLYLLTISKSTLVFDTRRPMDNGALRVTEWDQDFNAPAYNSDNGLTLSRDNEVYRYTGSLDSVLSDGTGGTTYQGEYEGGWLDFSAIVEGAGPLVKYLKKLHMTYVGGNGGTLTYKWTTDYQTAWNASSHSIPDTPGGAFFGGTANFGGTAFFGKTVNVGSKTKPSSRSGRVIKIGFLIQNSNSTFSVNRMDIFAKIGRLKQ